jgi:hypothetical protein
MKYLSSWLKEGCFNTLMTAILILIGVGVAVRYCGGPEAIPGESREFLSPDGARIARLSEITYSNGGFGASTSIEVTVRDKMEQAGNEALVLRTYDYAPRVAWDGNTTLIITLDQVSSIGESHRSIRGVNIVYRLAPGLTEDTLKSSPSFARWVSGNVEGR